MEDGSFSSRRCDQFPCRDSPQCYLDKLKPRDWEGRIIYNDSLQFSSSLESTGIHTIERFSLKTKSMSWNDRESFGMQDYPHKCVWIFAYPTSSIFSITSTEDVYKYDSLKKLSCAFIRRHRILPRYLQFQRNNNIVKYILEVYLSKIKR